MGDPSGQAKQVGGRVKQEGETENAVDQRSLLLAEGLHPQRPLRHKAEQDQNAAACDLLHRLPDKRAEERRSKQWGRGLQGRHSQEVERENRGAEAKGVGGGAEQQPRGRPSSDARAEAESDGLAPARM